MLERELKLHVPAGSRKALEAEISRAGASAISLRARYFDTDDRRLAKADIALRLRLEGEQWVQTIKAPGPDELSRLEYNHPRPGPELDLSVYRDTPLEGMFRRLGQALQMRYETDVNRLILRLDTGTGVVELAYDNGRVSADGLHLPIHELELELLSGDPANLFVMGQHWLEKHGLILDFRSKAERGDALARAALATKGSKRARSGKLTAEQARQVLKPRRARRLRFDEPPEMTEIYRQSASECLSQIIRNACFLAGVDRHSTSAQLDIDYVHQVRVGIRRLRSCRRLFNQWTPLDEGAPYLQELTEFFGLLGRERDQDVIRLATTPRLIMAGMPMTELPPTHRTTRRSSSRRVAASTPLQSCLLALLEQLIMANEQSLPDVAERQPARRLVKRLNRWLDRICTEGEHFHALSVDTQHDQRKKVKRLRYCLDFVSSLLSRKRLKAVEDALTVVQDALGDLNDLSIAQKHYSQLAPAHPPAMFALGWIAATHEQRKTDAQAAFIRLSEAGKLRSL